MNWLSTFLIYYVLMYVGIGGVLVRWLEVATWELMSGVFLGCLIGHYLGRSDRLARKWVSNG